VVSYDKPITQSSIIPPERKPLVKPQEPVKEVPPPKSTNQVDKTV
tara:strand:+ start:2018 stop:2152 length:135 start_codon:yes stop_codon:yes gene_type:complete